MHNDSISGAYPHPSITSVQDDLTLTVSDAADERIEHISSSIDSMLDDSDLISNDIHTDGETLNISSSRIDPGLRLPSFRALGISAAVIVTHPLSLTSSLEASLHSVPVRGQDSHNHGPAAAAMIGSDAVQRVRTLSSPSTSPTTYGRVSSPIQHEMAPLTPPAEVDVMSWHMATSASKIMSSTAMNSCRFSRLDTVKEDAEQPDLSPSSQYPGHTEAPSYLDGSPSSISQAIDEFISSLQHQPHGEETIKILSHALPTSSPTCHIYPTIIQRIPTITGQIKYINLLHAMSGRLNISDLPLSPPSTPLPNPTLTTDYFTQSVFPSAVPIHNYNLPPTHLPSHPTIQPSSLHLSVTERYIPPPTRHELHSAFNPTSSPSLLTDRLLELSPRNGTACFIYPTRSGARTFMQTYLSPVLDPLLRTLMVLHSLPDHLAAELGRMDAVDAMLEFEAMAERIEGLCGALSEMGGRSGVPSKWELVFAGTAEKVLDGSWAREWWVGQERARIREVVGRAVREVGWRRGGDGCGSSGGGERGLVAAELVQGILDGVVKGAERRVEVVGIEVGVFIVRRVML